MRPNLNMMGPGLSRLAAGITGNGYQQGYDNELSMQSKLAQALAAARAHDASASESMAKADEVRLKNDLMRQRPDMMVEQAALGSGSDVPMVRAILEQIRTGRAPVTQTMGPPDESGGLGGAETQFDPTVRSKVTQQLQRLFPIQVANDIKVDDWARAQGMYRNQDLGDQVLSGDRKAADVGRAQAAMEGKPLTGAHEFGVADLFSGALDTNNPVATRFGQYREATTGAQRANSAQSYASARHSDAGTKKINAEMADGANQRGQKAPTGYRWAANGALEPIPGGPADPATKGAKLAKPPTESQGKALSYAARMQVSDEILGELSAEGADQPSRIKQAVESLPMIGTAAGMAANSLASPKQRQVEQAQRNFINAVLRRESGAVISPEEFANANKQYFPQPNDDAETKANKADNRRVAIDTMKAEFGEQFAPEFESAVSKARDSRKARADPKLQSGLPAMAPRGRTVVRTGTHEGRKVVQYSDGTTEYAD